jgi:putative addiction module antidote
MATVLTLRRIGDSLGVIIPGDEIERMHLQEGDELFGLAIDNGLLLQPAFHRTLKAFENTRRQYREALGKLAK